MSQKKDLLDANDANDSNDAKLIQTDCRKKIFPFNFCFFCHPAFLPFCLSAPLFCFSWAAQ